MDLSFLGPLANLSLSIAGPLAVAVGMQYAKQHNLNTTYYGAVVRAGGAAYASLQGSGRPLNDPTAIANAIVAGAAYLLDPTLAGDAARAKGVTPESALKVVEAQLGTMLRPAR